MHIFCVGENKKILTYYVRNGEGNIINIIIIITCEYMPSGDDAEFFSTLVRTRKVISLSKLLNQVPYKK